MTTTDGPSRAHTAAPLLQVESIVAGYHSVPVLHEVSLEVADGELVSLLGANGAGKSTLMQVIVGLVRPFSGQVRLGGSQLLRRPTHARVAEGVAYVPEGRRVFPALTVEENLRAVNLKHAGVTLAEGLDTVYQLFPRLAERRTQLAGTLSGGEQQMLALARALISRPRLLLADEISLGLAPIIVEQLFGVLRDLNQSGMAILLAEQNALAALEVADRAYVIETGTITRQAPASQLLADASIVESYLQEM